jgi:hypothetical protein
MARTIVERDRAVNELGEKGPFVLAGTIALGDGGVVGLARR